MEYSDFGREAIDEDENTLYTSQQHSNEDLINDNAFSGSKLTENESGTHKDNDENNFAEDTQSISSPPDDIHLELTGMKEPHVEDNQDEFICSAEFEKTLDDLTFEINPSMEPPKIEKSIIGNPFTESKGDDGITDNATPGWTGLYRWICS